MFIGAVGQWFHVHDALSAFIRLYSNKFNSTFVYRNFIVTTVKESLKSIHVSQSYARNKKCAVFLTQSVHSISTAVNSP